jgi:3-hydroxyisobutyrate dehydrogenase
MAKAAFIGLGVMGFPMAGHLQAKGHAVTVFNRSPEKARRWAEVHGGRAAATVPEAVDGAEFVMLCVGRDDDVREVVAAAEPSLGEGAVVVDHTTTSAKLAQEMAERLGARSAGFVDAPVSGGQAGAENGQLTVMAGGAEDAFERAEPVMAAYSKAMRRIGESGAGQLAKMCNQICIAGAVAGVAEAVHFAKCAGLDPRPCWRRCARAPRSRGRWRTAGRRWSRTATTSASRWTGCARIWASPWTPRARTGRTSL